MKLVITKFGYSYWIGIDEAGNPYYNVTPEEQAAPNGGYFSEYICKIKNVPNLFLNY